VSLFNAQADVNCAILVKFLFSLYEMCRWVFRSLNFFCQTEIDYIDLVTMLANPYQEIVGLDVSMDKVARVNLFVHDHSIVIVLSPEPLDKRHFDAPASVL
jgi:hypothetical protein